MLSIRQNWSTGECIDKEVYKIVLLTPCLFLPYFSRDISLNNCIIIKESTIKLTSKTPSTESSDYCEYNGHILPLRHSAPEIIMSCKGKTNLEYSFASDIYALGITMWEILNKGSQPFKSLGKDDLIKKLQTKTLDYNSMGSVADDKVDTVLVRHNFILCYPKQY